VGGGLLRQGARHYVERHRQGGRMLRGLKRVHGYDDDIWFQSGGGKTLKNKEPAAEYVLNNIVEEEYCCKDHAAMTTTSDYSRGQEQAGVARLPTRLSQRPRAPRRAVSPSQRQRMWSLTKCVCPAISPRSLNTASPASAAQLQFI
jgi:hypothetical protein